MFTCLFLSLQETVFDNLQAMSKVI